MNVDQAISSACGSVGIMPPKGAARLGRWMKTDTIDGGKSGKGDGRVIVHEAHVTAWNWHTGEKKTVALKDAFTPAERRDLAKTIERDNRARRERAEETARTAAALMAKAATAPHPYLIGKGFQQERALVVNAADVRSIGGKYLIPDEGGERAILIPARIGTRISNVQLIWESGAKKFLFGGDMERAAHRIATGPFWWLCEGYAAGLSVRAALRGMKVQATILCCFSAANIVAVAQGMRGRVFIAADHDKPLPHFDGLGTGEHYARLTGLPYCMPPKVRTDFNDMHQQAGIFAVQKALTSVMAGRKAA